MKAKYWVLSLLGLVLGTNAVHAQDVQYLQSMRNTTYHRVHSEPLGRDFHVYVMTPDGYEAGDPKFPTIYLTDGGFLFPMLSGYYRYLQSGNEVPEAIIVGISYGAASFAEGNFRSTDYTAPSPNRDYYGGASKFQSFLESQVFPLVETKYHSDPKRRILFGQSIGGQFVLFTAHTRPDLFWGYIASNPAIHDNTELLLEMEPPSASSAKLFVASGTDDNPRFREPAKRWITHWTRQPNPPWDLHVVDLEGHSHMSAPPASFRAGLRWLFASKQANAQQ